MTLENFHKVVAETPQEVKDEVREQMELQEQQAITDFKVDIAAAIRSVLVIQNPGSMYRAVDKIYDIIKKREA